LNLVTAVVLSYVVGSLAVGMWVSRRIRTEDDYLLAGRSLGTTLGTFTIFATWFGAETCIGAAGAVYSEGLAGGSADPFGYGLCLVLMGAVFAVRLWKMRLTTLGDFFRRRYSPGVERVAVLLIAPTSILWAAAQIRAFGQVLTATSGYAVTTTITIAAVVVVVYTVSGGLLADAWTDLVQGIALVVGLVVLAIAVGSRHGTELLSAVPAERWNPFGTAGGHGLDVLESWAIPVLGSLFSAEVVARVIAMRHPSIARNATLAGAGTYVLVGLIPVALGLVGPAVVPGLADPEQLLPRLASEMLSPLLGAVFAGALVSAILSTVDSALLAAGSLVSHNVVLSLRPRTTEREKVRMARASVVVFGAVAYVLALHADGVYALVEEASAFGSAGIFVVAAIGISSRFGGPASALASILTGAAVWVCGAYVLAVDHPYLTSLVAAAVAYPLGALAVRASRSGARAL
jgi:Na+/proline symporter